ncbi:MAG TPA: FAD binding domain-containing protein, partial [Burkholderiales bacterium]|nr:FAD binding domain-containing protein [Burkholderiales bacterium]
MARRALVIGGSIASLFAANALRRIGWDATVFERVGEPLSGRGAGIGTHGELLAALRRLEVPVDDTVGVRVATRICLDRDGHVTHRLSTPQLQSSWGRIYSLLKDALPASGYRPGMALERFEQDGSGVTATFSDGTRERGDLLVGADGIRSTVREGLWPQAQPRYAGYVAWRGLVDESAFPPEIHAQLFHQYAMCLPEGEMMLTYPVPGRDNDTRPGRRCYNLIWYRPTDYHGTLRELCTDASGRCHGTSIQPPLLRPEVAARVRADARALLAPQIAALMELVEPLFFQAIFDLESPRMALGRVALVGDAAFVARPHVGVGVTKAALDAESLARELGAAADVESALDAYDRGRRPVGEQLVARARGLGAYIEARLKPPAERTEADRQPPPEFLLREIGAISLS